MGETNELVDADPEKRQRKTGVVYLQAIPPLFTVTSVRELLSKYAEIGRIYLQVEKRRVHGKKRKHYTEGWVEFASKREAKRLAQMLNGQQVGGRRRSAAYDTLWTMKYLSGFQWTHLMEQLVYERRVEEQRMRVEVSQAKRHAEHFAEQVEKGARIRRLEEKVLKKGGLWERYQAQIRQRKVLLEGRRKKSRDVGATDDFLRMVFDQQ